MANAQRNQTKSKPTANAAPPVIAAAKPAASATVAERAYQLWQQAGCPHGQDQEHWFQAEREVRARNARN